MASKEQMFRCAFGGPPWRSTPCVWYDGQKIMALAIPIPRCQFEATLDLLAEPEHLDWMLTQMRSRKVVEPFVSPIWAALGILNRSSERDAWLALITERAEAIDVPTDLMAGFQRDWAERRW